jgi:hypothetical protein
MQGTPQYVCIATTDDFIESQKNAWLLQAVRCWILDSIADVCEHLTSHEAAAPR